MVTAVDTNILLDIALGFPLEATIARKALEKAESQGSLVSSAVCFAEIAGKYPNKQAITAFFRDLTIAVLPVDEETAFLAGKFFREYKLRGGTRDRILPDFLIAAHAQLYADRLLTRDHRFFTGSFQGLIAVAPQDL